MTDTDSVDIETEAFTDVYIKLQIPLLVIGDSIITDRHRDSLAGLSSKFSTVSSASEQKVPTVTILLGRSRALGDATGYQHYRDYAHRVHVNHMKAAHSLSRSNTSCCSPDCV